ncbi:MAG: endo alpha-1,4 polygalactosaminidase [Verrucomicrobiales bacterium]|nr:endo alpha-1,4 polygalactosaminidase [Verrucomicrobiales bacterium]
MVLRGLRPDAKRFDRKIGKPGEWKGEWYIDWKGGRTKAVMNGRLDPARRKGFRGVDIDNVEGS